MINPNDNQHWLSPDKKVLLYSGGLDSWFIKELWNPDVLLYVNMGVDYQEAEIESLKKENDPRLKIIEFPLVQFEDKESKFIPARNLFLLTLAALYGNRICIGAVVEDTMPDKTDIFLHMMEKTLQIVLAQRVWEYSGEGISLSDIQIETKYKKLTKPKLLAKYIQKGGDIFRAWETISSCHEPIKTDDGWMPCGRCNPCYQKFYTFYLNGFRGVEEDYKRKSIERIKEEVTIRRKHNRLKLLDECWKQIQKEGDYDK